MAKPAWKMTKSSEKPDLTDKLDKLDKLDRPHPEFQANPGVCPLCAWGSVLGGVRLES